MEQTESILDWSDGMGFGIADLDAAERRLAVLVQELNQAIADRCDREDMQRLANQLLLDALSHFEYEERVFLENAYPLPKGHAALHVQMRAELEHALARVCDAESQAMQTEYGLLVKQLFVEHMRQEMRKYRASLRPGPISGTHAM